MKKDINKASTQKSTDPLNDIIKNANKKNSTPPAPKAKPIKDKTEDKKPNPVGRPTDLNAQVQTKIIELIEQGKTDEQAAEIVGCHVNTIRRWFNLIPEFKWAIKEAKQAADDIVEASLFLRACGYKHKAVKIFCHEGMIVEHEYMEHYPPDTSAAIFWLKNRKRGEWRDKFPEDSQPMQVNIAPTPLNEELASKILDAVAKISK